MRFQERLPGRGPLARGRRLNAVRLENIANAGIRHVMSQVGQRALDAIIAPTWIFPCQTHHQFLNLFGKVWTSGLVLAALAKIPLLGHQQAMPAQERVWSYQGAYFRKQLAAKYIGLDGEATALVVVKENPAFASMTCCC